MSDASTISLPDGGRLNVRIEGPEGAPWLVFSNSVMTDLSVWDAQVAALADRFRILRYDQRGHGGSSLPAGQMDFTAYGADVIALLDACGVRRCTFVGLSMGVPTGLAAYAAIPERFARFVAVDGVSRSAPEREAFWRERRDTARANGMTSIANDTVPRWLPAVEESDPMTTQLQAMIAATPVEGFTAATSALQSYDFSEVVPTLACPFLGISGQKDGTMPQAMRDQFAKAPTPHFADIPDAGHLPNFQTPNTFNAAIRAFLDATAPDTSKETH